MFWTKWVRGFNIVVMYVGILVSLISGGILAIKEGATFLLIIPAGVLITITCVSLTMMITEISVTLDEINTTLKKQNKKKQQNKNSSSGSLYASEPEYHSGSSSWVCS